MTEGFRIGRIRIEGFKGFTKPKEIDLKNRHVFLLGQNGNGKSSVIEAIRWGLFGSTRRPNDIVENQGYGGRCRVELELVRDGIEWRLNRNLIRGVSGGSDATLADRDGNEHPMRAVLPQIDSLDAGEGTHIIFAPQSTPLRRQPEDLTPFERSVFGHLGLTHARAILSHLRAFVEEQEMEVSNLDERISDVLKRVERRTAELERQRGRILQSPLWNADRPPSIAETEKKAKELIQEISVSKSESELGQHSLEALVDVAERALEERTDQDRAPLDEKLKRIDDQVTQLETIHRASEDVAAQRNNLNRVKEQLNEVLNGVSLDELNKSVKKQRGEAGNLALRHRLAEIATELLEREESNDFVLCPICRTQQKDDGFKAALATMIHADNEEESANLRAIEDRWKKAREFEIEAKDIKQEIEKLNGDLSAMIKTNDDVQLAKVINEGRISDHIQEVTKQRIPIAKQIDSYQDWLDAANARLSKLREETQYQQLQKDLRDLAGVKADMDRLNRAFKELVQFGESVSDICSAVDSTLKEDLRKKIPVVAQELTNVFGALTRHPHFDQLLIDEDKLPRLELGVGSSNDSSPISHPAGVLNGQAQSALELVPYFALSQADEAPTEVYLVLLDDPTRAFDREHIEILIERLSDLGKRVQVIVATQETEVFREILPAIFPRESYVIIEPKNWSYADGPILDVDYG